MAWADAHCHLHDDKVAAGSPLVDALAAGVRRIVTVGTDRASSEQAVAIARASDASNGGAADVEVWATAGLHPHDASRGWDWIDALLADAAAHRIVAVGECGLDYWYDHSPRLIQRDAFAAQIGLAHRHKLPLVIHTRDAWDDTFAVLTSEGVPERTIFHCFTGGPSEAERCLSLGAYLSFSGIVTFKSAADLRAAAAITPISRLLVETDAPYLAPVPHRGKPNRPAWVPLVGAVIADLRGEAVGLIETATWQNTAQAFGLDPEMPPPAGAWATAVS